MAWLGLVVLVLLVLALLPGLGRRCVAFRRAAANGTEPSESAQSLTASLAQSQDTARTSSPAAVATEEIEGAAEEHVAGAAAPVEYCLATTPDLILERDPELGTPRFVRRRSGYLSTAAHDRTPAEIAAAFVDANQKLFTLHPSDIEGTNAVVVRDLLTRHSGMRSLTWQQQRDGIDIFGATVAMSLTHDGRIINAQSRALHLPCVRFHDRVTVTVTDAEKLAEVYLNAQQPTANTQDPTQSVRPTAAIWYPLDMIGVVKAWDLMVERTLTPGAPPALRRLIIRADTGEVVEDIDLTWGALEAASYNVYTGDSPEPMTPGPGAPTNFVPSEVSREVVALAALDTNASPEGWIPVGESRLVGNNATVYADWDDNDSRDAPPLDSTPYRVFDLACDLTADPTDYVDFSQAQAFYLANQFHDRLHQLGFDEAAGNFQSDNFGRGGSQNDALIIEVQNGANLGYEYGNQAWYQGWGDGSQGKVVISVFGRSSPHRCGILDAQLVYHEITHGLSSRLIGDGFGLTTVPTRGMAEGWSDFFALTLPAEAADDIHGCYPFATYAAIYHDTVGSHYYGIRRFPYSTQTNKAPQTIADIDPNQQFFPPEVPRNPDFGSTEADQMHNIGEVWCLMLWECRANLIEAYGFVGNEMMMQLVVDGMKLTPVNPTFIEGRDAVLQADLVSNAGTNQIALWQGFAKRGLGYGATVPPSVSTVGIVESYDLPFEVGVQLQEVGGDGDGYVEPGEDGALKVVLTSHEMALSAIAGELTHGADGNSGNLTITSSQTLWPDLGVGGVSTSAPPFSFSVSTNFPGNSDASFVLRVESDKGGFEEPLSVRIGNPYDYAPEISGIAVTNIGENQAWVSWQTGIASTGRVDYGLSTDYLAGAEESTGGMKTEHSVKLSGLTPGADYHYRISACGSNGLMALSPDGVFRTRSRIYVSVDSTASQELGTINAPFKTLQAAAEAAKVNADTMLVAAGVYTGSGSEAVLECANAAYDLTIEGGYSLDFGECDPEVYVTTLDGQQSRRGIWLDNGAKVAIRGVTITHGQGEWGGGVHVRKSEFSAKECVIVDNASTTGINKLGGGVYAALASQLLIDACVVSNNFADFGGGVVGVSADTTVLLNGSVLTDNAVTYTGGGIHVLLAASTIIQGSVFVHNNGSYTGGGIDILPYSDATVDSSTIVSNQAPLATDPYLYGGGGISVAGPTSTAVLILRNSLVWGNTSPYGGDLRCALKSEIHANYCNIGDIYGTLTTSNHIISVDPLFADPERGDFHLLYGSPCIDAGLPNYGGGTVDLDGEARPFGAAVDIGADEFVDLDVDHMADYWERLKFGDLVTSDGTGDLDLDELDDVGEYMQQTDPHNRDTEGDLMPDGWEVAHSLNPKGDDAGLDADGDQFLNFSEYAADTDPHNAESLLRIRSLQQNRGGLRLEWQGGVWAQQTIERSAEAGSGAIWRTAFVAHPPTYGTNVVWIFQSAEQQFYRIKAERVD